MADLYHKHLEKARERLAASSISSEDKKLINKYLLQRQGAGGLKEPRLYKTCHILTRLCEMLKTSFKKATKDDLIALSIILDGGKTPERKLKNGGTIPGKPWSQHTKADYKIILKAFYKWFKGNDETYPPEVSWMKKLHSGKNKLNPEDMLDEEEIQKMIDSASNPRDRALISILAESGVRIGELIFLNIEHVQFDKDGAVLFVDGKTGQRRVRIVASVPYLIEWMNIHPKKDNRKSPLWTMGLCMNKIRRLEYPAANKLLRKTAMIAGIKKRVNPHMFRHSRATFMANRLTDAQLKQYFGWTQGSDMAATYIHMSGRDIDNAILGVYGIKTEAHSEESKLVPKQCPRCNRTNGVTTKVCKCGYPLDPEIALQNYTAEADFNKLIMNRMNKMEAILKKKIQPRR